MTKTTLLSLGLMSGTSMDGIDAALIRTDGESFVEELASHVLPYPAELKHLLKAAERAVKQARGLNVLDYEKELQAYLQIDCGISDPCLQSYRDQWNEGRAFTLADIVRLSTDWHIRASRELLAQANLSAPDVVGYHGQTVYHNPKERCTLQIGDGAFLAAALSAPVIANFRENDVKAGGQGAPFAPIYHQALAKRDHFIPCAVINCGGVANVTMITETSLRGFDTGPGNCLLDRFIALKTGELFDRDGKYALQGGVNETVLQALWNQSCVLCGENFYEKKPPKSLDNRDVQLIPEVMALSVADGAATLASFTALTIAKALLAENSLPDLIILAGGGWYHPVIVSELKRYLPAHVELKTAQAVGWQNDVLEAQLFAYLAVRRLKELPASFPQTTGVAQPMVGGVLCLSPA